GRVWTEVRLILADVGELPGDPRGAARRRYQADGSQEHPAPSGSRGRDYHIVDPPAARLRHHVRARVESNLHGRRPADVRGQVESRDSPGEVLLGVSGDLGPRSAPIA